MQYLLLGYTIFVPINLLLVALNIALTRKKYGKVYTSTLEVLIAIGIILLGWIGSTLLLIILICRGILGIIYSFLTKQIRLF